MLLYLLASLFGLVAAKAYPPREPTSTFKWDVSYVTAAPDGVPRPVIGVNGQFPPPTIEVKKHDVVELQITNLFTDGESLSVHSHGLLENGTNFYDGVPQVTQCGIAAGTSFTYYIHAGEQTGTYWIHSHVIGQYPNGFRAPLIIIDPDTPYKYDREEVVSVSDWYNQTMQVLIPEFMSTENADGVEPIPDAALIWDKQNGTYAVTPGETVRFHLANIAAFAFFHIWIEDHTMTVIEVDGVDVEPYDTPGVSLAVGQRLSVLVKMDANPKQNYPFVAAMDQNMFDEPSLRPNATAWLVYDCDALLPEPGLVQEFVDFDDTDLVPLDALPPVPYDSLVTVNVNFTQYNGINYAVINNQTYEAASVPSLFTALTTGNKADDPATYGSTTNTFVLNHLDMVWIAINNFDSGNHPFHLHGHSFQVLFRSQEGSGPFDAGNVPPMKSNPLRRDVILVPAGGYVIIALRADNPGVCHCHIDWHIIAGMVAQFVEAPFIIQERIKVPSQVSEQCIAQGIPISGPGISPPSP